MKRPNLDKASSVGFASYWVKGFRKEKLRRETKRTSSTNCSSGSIWNRYRRSFLQPVSAYSVPTERTI